MSIMQLVFNKPNKLSIYSAEVDSSQRSEWGNSNRTAYIYPPRRPKSLKIPHHFHSPSSVERQKPLVTPSRCLKLCFSAHRPSGLLQHQLFLKRISFSFTIEALQSIWLLGRRVPTDLELEDVGLVQTVKVLLAQ